jgi:hypothetical protein
MRYWLWAIPKGETDRLYERPLTSMALTLAQVEQVTRAAGAEGWHSFRTVPDDNAVPDFAGAIKR